MKLNKLAKLASVSAIALGCAYAAPANAAPVAFELDSTTTVAVNAAVDNTVNVVITAVDLTTIGATSDAVDTATLTMAPGGAITEDIAGDAHIVSDDGTGTPGNIAITGAFATTDLFVDYFNPVDLNCGACANGPPDFTLSEVTDDLATPSVLSTATTGKGTTDNAGALAWNIGVSIQTQASANRYETGAYAGSFDMIVAY